jgi:hypothetical protein
MNLIVCRLNCRSLGVLRLNVTALNVPGLVDVQRAPSARCGNNLEPDLDLVDEDIGGLPFPFTDVEIESFYR